MKVALVQLPHVWKGNYRPPTEYPLGLGYLASILRDDHCVFPVDLWQNPLPPSKAARLWEFDKSDVICISVYSTQYPYFRALTRAIHESRPGVPIIAGGPGATHSYEILLENGADYCVIGEGENTLHELLSSEGFGDRDWRSGINGIAYIDKGKTVVTPPREQIKDLDCLPLPDREKFNLRKYIENSRKAEGLLKGYRSTNLIAGRGCPYSCTFCSKGFEGVRLRKVGQIASEIEYLKGRYHLNAVEFNDELVITSKKRILELCEALRPIDIAWGCQGRVNVVDREVLVAMKRAGCIYIGYGVESYTQRILDSMHKGTRVYQILPAINATRAAGIKPVIQYMFGFPGEDETSLKDTERFFRQVDVPYIGMMTTPIPGTRSYEVAKEEGKICDEERYLIKLSAGYNSPTPLVSLTGWSLEELYEKHEELARKINEEYYSRHSWRFIRKSISRVSNAMARRLK